MFCEFNGRDSRVGISPCFKCENRNLGCHSSCLDYMLWKVKLDARNEEVRENKEEENNSLKARIESMNRANPNVKKCGRYL